MADMPLERLRFLYDYEKFHIGLYGAMITGFIAILSLWSKDLPWWVITVLSVAIILLLVAAICGATLASSVIDIYGTYSVWKVEAKGEPNLDLFWTKKIGPYKATWWTAQAWWRIGHGAFWLAVSLVVSAFLVRVLCTVYLAVITFWLRLQYGEVINLISRIGKCLQSR